MGSRRDPTRPNAGRSGGRWRAARLAVLERDAGICRHCGHGGAGEADHYPLSLAQLRALGEDPDSPDHLVAAHGTSARCPVCHAACNQDRQAKGWRPPQVVLCRFAGQGQHPVHCVLRHSEAW